MNYRKQQEYQEVYALIPVPGEISIYALTGKVVGFNPKTNQYGIEQKSGGKTRVSWIHESMVFETKQSLERACARILDKMLETSGRVLSMFPYTIKQFPIREQAI